MKIATTILFLVPLLGACSSRACDEPPPWKEADLHLRVTHHVTSGSEAELAFDGQAISAEQLVSKLNAIPSGNDFPPAVVFSRNRGLACSEVEYVRSLMAETKICRSGNCAEVEAPPPPPN